jgi:type IV pilus assembly protein PilV
MRAVRNDTTRLAAGFSLIEVMVALIVLSVGLLGIARMESLAMSSTTVANQRGLAAIEAASLAAAMHANRGYWAGSDTSLATIKISSTTTGITFAFTHGPNLQAAGSPDCTSGGGPCTPTNLAAYDLHQWATALQGMLPAYTATIACGNVTPITCTIQITWLENVVAVNAQEAVQQSKNPTTAAMQNPQYTLYVQP